MTRLGAAKTSQREGASAVLPITYSTRPIDLDTITSMQEMGSLATPEDYRSYIDSLLSMDASDEYCTNRSVEDWSDISSETTCGGPDGNFASLTRVEFWSGTSATNLQIQIGPDYGLGGAVFLDGEPIAFNPNDMWQGAGDMFSVSLPVPIGPHVLEAYGMEDCCDGSTFGGYQVAGRAFTIFGTAPSCDPTSISPTTIVPGVSYYDCSATRTNVHIVTIDRNLPNYEIQVLADPDPPAGPGELHLRTVEEHTRTHNALVGINGYLWRGPNGVIILGDGTPVTTTIQNGMQITSNTSECTAFPDQHPCSETLLGFPRGIVDIMKNPQSGAYQYNLYGTNTSVIIDSQCRDDQTLSNWSIVGYSPTQIIFLTTGESYAPADLCQTLLAFGAVQALRNDGASAAAMFINSATVGLNGKRIDPSGVNRHVAFALGLVPVP